MANDGKALFDRTEWQAAAFESESERPRGNRFERRPRFERGGPRDDRQGNGRPGNGRSGGRRRHVSS